MKNILITGGSGLVGKKNHWFTGKKRLYCSLAQP
jgi:hypothetical protein